MEVHEASSGHARANRIFYLSIPPSVFVSVAQNASRYASSTTGARRGARGGRWPLPGYTRVIVEKPFGRDLESSRELTRGLAEDLTEDQIYRCARPAAPPTPLIRQAAQHW